MLTDVPDKNCRFITMFSCLFNSNINAVCNCLNINTFSNIIATITNDSSLFGIWSMVEYPLEKVITDQTVKLDL